MSKRISKTEAAARRFFGDLSPGERMDLHDDLFRGEDIAAKWDTDNCGDRAFFESCLVVLASRWELYGC